MFRIELLPRSFACVLIKRWRTIIATTIAGSVISVLVICLLPRMYKADALIMLEGHGFSERYVASSTNVDAQENVAAIIQDVLSATRLQQVIDECGLYKDKRDKVPQDEIIKSLRDDISLVLEKTGPQERVIAFRVGYHAADPFLAAQVVSRVAHLFIEENVRIRSTQASQTADFIDSQLRDASNALGDLETKLSQFKRKHNGSLPEQAGVLSSTLGRLQSELQGTQDALNRTQQHRLALEGTMSILQARAIRPFTDGERDSSHSEAISAEVQDLRLQIAHANEEMTKQNAERDRILRLMDGYQSRLEQVALLELEMAPLNREYEMAKGNYKSLLEKKASALMASDMEKRTDRNGFTIIDLPRVPKVPSGPPRRLFATIGVLLSGCLGVVIAILADKRKNVILGEWELGTDVNILGRIPSLPASEGSMHQTDRILSIWTSKTCDERS